MSALLTLQASFAAALLGDDDEPVLHRLRGGCAVRMPRAGWRSIATTCCTV